MRNCRSAAGTKVGPWLGASPYTAGSALVVRDTWPAATRPAREIGYCSLTFFGIQNVGS